MDRIKQRLASFCHRKNRHAGPVPTRKQVRAGKAPDRVDAANGDAYPQATPTGVKHEDPSPGNRLGAALQVPAVRDQGIQTQTLAFDIPEHVRQVIERVQCPILYRPMTDALRLPCGHAMSAEGLQDAYDPARPACPCCRKPLEDRPTEKMADYAMRALSAKVTRAFPSGNLEGASSEALTLFLMNMLPAAFEPEHAPVDAEAEKATLQAIKQFFDLGGEEPKISEPLTERIKGVLNAAMDDAIAREREDGISRILDLVAFYARVMLSDGAPKLKDLAARTIHSDVRVSVERALVGVGVDPRTRLSLSRDHMHSRFVVERIAGMDDFVAINGNKPGAHALAEMEEKTRDPSPFGRVVALEHYVKWAGDAAYKRLAEMSRDLDGFVRLNVYLLTAQLKPEGHDLLLAAELAMLDTHPLLRERALSDYIGLQPDPMPKEVIAHLEFMTHDDDRHVRRVALSAYRKVGGDAAKARAAALLPDEINVEAVHANPHLQAMGVLRGWGATSTHGDAARDLDMMLRMREGPERQATPELQVSLDAWQPDLEAIDLLMDVLETYEESAYGHGEVTLGLLNAMLYLQGPAAHVSLCEGATCIMSDDRMNYPSLAAKLRDMQLMVFESNVNLWLHGSSVYMHGSAHPSGMAAAVLSASEYCLAALRAAVAKDLVSGNHNEVTKLFSELFYSPCLEAAAMTFQDYFDVPLAANLEGLDDANSQCAEYARVHFLVQKRRYLNVAVDGDNENYDVRRDDQFLKNWYNATTLSRYLEREGFLAGRSSAEVDALLAHQVELGTLDRAVTQ